MRAKSLLISLILMLPLCAAAQSMPVGGIEVVYKSTYKGNQMPGGILMTVSQDKVSIEYMSQDGQDPRNSRGLRSRNFIDYEQLKSYTLAQLPDGRTISSSSKIELGGSRFKEIGKEKILGYDCTVVRTSVNSNTIDISYTTQAVFRGTPQPGVGVPDGLVLKIVRNGDQVQEAVSVQQLPGTRNVLPESWGEEMTPFDFQYEINQSQVISVPVFNQDTICFNGAKLPDTELQSGVLYRCGGGSVIIKKVKLPENVSDRSVFAELVQYSAGDAYDRTGSVFMIPVEKSKSFIDALRELSSVPSQRFAGKDYPALVSTADYDAPIELMRFFTGFGVRQYNHIKVKGQQWADSVLYKNEITHLAERLSGEVWIGAYIGNWDGNGHRLSLKLKYYPDSQHRVLKTKSLFNTVNLMEQQGQSYPDFLGADSLKVRFTLSEDAPSARLVYLTSGHGGWGGGDEFNQKANTIILDGKQVISFIPWREDCATYRNNNPCSGNFSNGLSSSDLSRSNWCPGTVTNPEHIYLGDLKAGEHEITVSIPQGKPEGSSISYWCLSGVLVY